MKMIQYDKLVRDGIPAKLRAKGIIHTIKVASVEEMTGLLMVKLQEEIKEFKSAESRNDKAKELADILEVLSSLDAHLAGKESVSVTVDAIYDLGHELGFSRNEIEALRAAKLSESGGFEDRIVLIEAEEPK
jgi:predicted house-cleaning noncanonical NTP pyrophosphatase (MazG superfamily)